MAQCEAQIELHAGNPAAADKVLVRSTEFLAAAGDSGNRPLQQALHSVILARLGRTEEALELSRKGEAAAPLVGQAYWRCGRALALAAQGRHGEAIELAQTGAGMMSRSGDLHGRGEMLESLADVLLAAGDTMEGTRRSSRPGPCSRRRAARSAPSGRATGFPRWKRSSRETQSDCPGHCGHVSPARSSIPRPLACPPVNARGRG